MGSTDYIYIAIIVKKGINLRRSKRAWEMMEGEKRRGDIIIF